MLSQHHITIRCLTPPRNMGILYCISPRAF